MWLNLISSLPFLVSLFWLVVFLADQRGADPARKLLTYFMLICTILYFCHAVYFHKQIYLYSLIESIYTFTSLAVYPFYYLYICKLTSERSLKVRDYWVLLPALTISICSLLFYALMSENERLNFVKSFLFDNDASTYGSSFAVSGQIIRIYITKLVFLLQLIPVTYFGYKRLSNFNRQINNFYSNTQNKTMAPIKIMLTLFILFAFFSATANHLGRSYFLQETGLIAIPSLIFSTMIFSVCFVGLKQSFTAKDFDLETRTAYKSEMNNPFSNQETLIERIRVLMEEELFFKQRDLQISDVALRVGSNRTYVSNYLNRELNLSFSDYINKYRIDYAKSLMSIKNNPLTILEVSEQSGFANEVSFYRNFKKFTGTSPKKWHKQLLTSIQ